MAFLDNVLDPPAYGWADRSGKLIKPTANQIFKEFFTRLNAFQNRKNWLPFFSWIRVIVLIPLFFLFLFKFFSIGLLIVFFIYSMIAMGTHGTIWHHRYCTHGAYTFKNNFWKLVTQNLTISMIPEEIYVISHHVHHAKSDQPGDPYNASAGFLFEWRCSNHRIFLISFYFNSILFSYPNHIFIFKMRFPEYFIYIPQCRP